MSLHQGATGAGTVGNAYTGGSPGPVDTGRAFVGQGLLGGGKPNKPSAAVTATPGPATVTVTAYTPGITTSGSATPGVATVTVTAYAPTTTGSGITVTPGVAQVVVGGYAAFGSSGAFPVAQVASVAVAAYTPVATITGGTYIATPGVATVSVGAYSPSVTTQSKIQPVPITLSEVWQQMIATLNGVEPADSELRQLMLAFATAVANAIGGAGPAGGDLSGLYPNPTVVAVQGEPISAILPETGQTFIWDGTFWTPTTVSSLPPSGPAGGDLANAYPNPTVVQIQGQPIFNGPPSSGESLVYNGTTWTPEILVPDSGWLAASLIPPWTNFGSGGTTPGYRKVGNVVYLRGLINNGASGTEAFVLPSGYAPVGTQEFCMGTDTDSGAVVQIVSSGAVTPSYNGSPDYVALDGVNFTVN